MRVHPDWKGHEDDENGQEWLLYDCKRIPIFDRPMIDMLLRTSIVC